MAGGSKAAPCRHFQDTEALLAAVVEDRLRALAAWLREAAAPHEGDRLPIMARARDRQRYAQLKRLGITHVLRETFGSAHDMGISALQQLGHQAHTAHRLAWR